MDVVDELSRRGFSLAARLTWLESDPDIQFAFADWTPQCRLEGIIYAYVDVDARRVLNIGQTGGSFRARSGGYKSWLNGKDKNRNAPINGAWLNCLLGECSSSKVEIWVKQSFVDKVKREAEESELIRTLRPVLNTKA